jgi:hypothetical protein
VINEEALSYTRGTVVEFNLGLGGGPRKCRGLVLNTAVLFGRGARQIWILDIDDATAELQQQWINKKHIVQEEDIIAAIPSTVIGGDTILRDNPVSFPVQDAVRGEWDTPAATITIAVPIPSKA